MRVTGESGKDDAVNDCTSPAASSAAGAAIAAIAATLRAG